MIAARSGCHVALARVLVDYAKLTRRAAETGEISEGVGPRRLIALAGLLHDGRPLSRALDAALFSRCRDDEAETLRQLASAHVSESEIDAARTGATVPTLESTPAPAGNPAPEFGVVDMGGN